MTSDNDKLKSVKNDSVENSSENRSGTNEHVPKNKAAKKARNIISTLMIIAGVLLIAVPSVLTYLNNRRNDDIIDEFLAQADLAMNDAESLYEEDVENFYIPDQLSNSEHNAPEETDLLDETGNEQVDDSQDSHQHTEDQNSESSTPAPKKKPLMSKSEIQKRMTGVLIIDKIGVRMIVMDGVDEETLRVAAGRMPNTAKLDEVGNCVLAGHRSYTFGKYFNRLDELEPGDEIIIQTPAKTLKYTVYKTHIVEPDDFSITKGNGTDKILTLFTCHPVAIASHRLVVHAKQVE
jgi:sortase A